MEHNEMYSLIESGLLEGKSKGDIFRSLGGTDDLASAVAATPYFDDRKNMQSSTCLLW